MRKERERPRKKRSSCVALNTLASARNETSQQETQLLRSIKHVFMYNEKLLHPTPPQPQLLHTVA